MGEFGSWVFWKRDPVFVLIFHLWENFCHWQFKGHAANIMSICCYGGIYDFIELGRKVCGGSRCSGREERWRRKKKKKKRKWPVWSEDGKSGLIFVSNVFPSTYGPCFGLYTENLRGDPWPGSSDWHNFGCLTLSSIWPRVPEVQGSPPGSSKLTQCVKPGMTPCSAELCCLNILLFSTCIHLMLSHLLSLSFLWVILNSTSLQSLWCVTNFSPPPPPLTSLILFCWNPTSLHGNHFSPILLCLFFFSDIFFLSFRQDLSVWSSLSHHFSLSPNPPYSVSLPAVKDVSVQLSQIMFACPAVKTGGCPFHSTSHTTKGDGREEGFNARVWTQAIISNYCFSFQFPCPDGGPTRRTCNNPLQSSGISGPRSPGSVLGLLGFHLNVSQELIQTWSDGRINPWDPAFNGLS